MGHVRRFDHIGVTVADLDAATAFFVGLGLEVEGTASVKGEFVETVCGIPGAHCEIVMLRPPDGGSRLGRGGESSPAVFTNSCRSPTSTNQETFPESWVRCPNSSMTRAWRRT
jgi:catechol 2,3-dioxygenase-like lactoylglutathione lyase family enzyme